MRRDFAGKTRPEVHLPLVVLELGQSCQARRLLLILERGTWARHSGQPILVVGHTLADPVAEDTRAFRAVVDMGSIADAARTADWNWRWTDL